MADTRNRPASDDQLAGRQAHDDVAESATLRDSSDRLQTSLSLLPDTQREVITLAFYGQLTHTEIAVRLGLPAGTVKGRMRLGLKELHANHEEA